MEPLSLQRRSTSPCLIGDMQKKNLPLTSQRKDSMGHKIQWVGLRENVQENPIFNEKIYGFL